MRILMNSVYIFWHRINKERLKYSMVLEIQKDSYSSKTSLYVELYFNMIL